jgi:hypothetical protein
VCLSWPSLLGVTVSPLKRSMFLFALYMCSILLVATPVAAQTPTPTAAISLTCAPNNIDIQVNPGAIPSGYTTCTLENPTSWIEKVAIMVTSDGMATASPGNMYVGGGAEVDFQVSVRADPYMDVQARQLTISATVQEINGLPPINQADSTNTLIVNIEQYSLVQVEAVEPFVQLMPKVDKNFEFKVYNLGNQVDFMKVGITDDSRKALEKAGFTINLPAVKVQLESKVAPQKVRVMIRTPKNQGWTDAYHVLDFYAESDFACQNGGCMRESQMITIYVRGVYLPGFEVIPALSMLVLAAAVVGRRLNADEEEGISEWRECAPGL